MQTKLPLRASILISLIATASLSLTGCHNTVSSEGDGSGGDNKLEHVIPAHKPKSFSEAVAALESRWSESQEWSDTARQEFKDIVEWLPELAAQTDLQKDDWDKINELSLKMKANLNQQTVSPELFQQDLKQLNELKRKAEENDFFKIIHQEQEKE